MRRPSLLLACLAALALAPAAHATFPGQNGRIAYGVDGTDYRALVTFESDSRGDRFLRECREEEADSDDNDCSIRYRSPAWDPDGRRLAFDAGDALALIARDGSDFELLAGHTRDDGQPAFSRSGRQLAFSGRSGGGSAVYVRDLARDRVRRVASGAAPDFSRRGIIAYTRRGAVYAVRPNGRRPRRVVRGRDPGWSPSGRSIAYARRGGIYVVGADGRRPRRVVRCSGCGEPAFSPNGRMIVYEDGGLRLVRVRGGRPKRLIENAGTAFRAFEPAWQAR